MLEKVEEHFNTFDEKVRNCFPNTSLKEEQSQKRIEQSFGFKLKKEKQINKGKHRERK